jgi:hypothetical protein
LNSPRNTVPRTSRMTISLQTFERAEERRFCDHEETVRVDDAEGHVVP